MRRWNWGFGIGLLAACVSAQAAIGITCSSERGGREYCPADTSGGVQLTRQVSTLVCRKGYSWDKDASGIWVDHGCKAEFSVSELGLLGSLVDRGSDYQKTQTFQCSASGKKRHYCQADTRGGLRLVSGSCVYGKAWGYDAGGVWVERGCSAGFEVGGGSTYKPPEVQGTGHVWGAGNGLKSVACSSDDGKRKTCDADTSEGAVMVKDLSGNLCIRNETWGVERRGVWVDKGCKGQFDAINREVIRQ